MKPCLKFVHNSAWRQIWHIICELKEVVVEIAKGNKNRAAEELVDVQVACETLLYILGYRSKCDRNHIRNLVDQKNEKRGYHGGIKSI